MAAQYQKLTDKHINVHIYIFFFLFPSCDKKESLIYHIICSCLTSTVKPLMMRLPALILSCASRERWPTCSDSCSGTEKLLFYTWTCSILPCWEVILWCWCWSSRWWILPVCFHLPPLIAVFSHPGTSSPVIFTWNTLCTYFRLFISHVSFFESAVSPSSLKPNSFQQLSADPKSCFIFLLFNSGFLYLFDPLATFPLYVCKRTHTHTYSSSASICWHHTRRLISRQFQHKVTGLLSAKHHKSYLELSSERPLTFFLLLSKFSFSSSALKWDILVF